MTNAVQSTTLDIQRIVSQSAPIFERLNDNFTPVATTTNDKTISARLQKWRDALSDGDELVLAKRLAWEGHTIDTVRPLLGEAMLPDNYPLPEWTSYLEQALAICNWLASRPLSEHQAAAKRLFNADEPLPYEDVLFPFVIAAEEALRASAGHNYTLLSDRAHAALAHNLLKRLTTISAHCLELEFSITRFARQSSLSRLLQSSGPPQKELYRSFAQHMLAGRMVSFLEEYAVLARLIGTAMALWVATTGEFLQRLAADFDSIRDIFCPHCPAGPGQVIAVEADLSDPHNRGRTVIILTFAAGLKLVYKPKNLGIEESFYQFMAWLNKKEVFPPFKLFKFINRSTYGWCEFVEHPPCQDEAEVKRYYQRAGILVAWLYALEATDCHYENIIACGEHPVLIDLETIIHQRSALEVQHDEDNTESQSIAHEYLWHSVFRTGFLPQWQFSKNGDSYDGSGLASSDDQASIVQVPRWEAVNTDNMRLSVDLYQARTRVNVPHLNGKIMPLDNYIEDFVHGFCQAYRFMLENRQLILSADSPLPRLFAQSVRHIFRNTSNYVSAMESALHPKFLRNGADRSIALDGFNRSYVAKYDTRPPFWEAIAHERQSMELLDIPFFKTAVNSRDLAGADGQVVIKDHFPQSAAALVRARFDQLSQEDLERQTSFIKASLYSRVTRPSGRGDTRIDMSNQESVPPMPTADLVAQATHIAAELNNQAIRANDGSLSWVALGYIEYAQKYRLQPMDYDLYNGSAGVGVFLAALAHVTKDDQVGSQAQGALLLLRQHLQNAAVSQKMARRIGLGAATGIGSLIYALVKISHFLSEPELLVEAAAAARLITPELINQDTHLDVARGAAGAILGLLALYESTGEAALLDTANACADHLLQRRVASGNGYLVWPNHSGQLLTGILHGAAGYAYALLRLYAHTQRPSLLEAAEQAIAYENSLFSAAQQNWLVYEGATSQETMATWCHGAPGIGLARLGCLPILDTAATRHDIKAALNTSLRLGLTGIDHLCCGNFGRLELLLKASQTLADDSLAQRAQQWAAWSVGRMEETGHYYFSPDIPRDVYQPALFTGTSGIGYALLRLAYPTELPSIMLWE